MNEMVAHLQSVGFEVDMVYADGAFHKDEIKKLWYIARDMGQGRMLLTYGDYKTGQHFTKKFGFPEDDESWREIAKEHLKIKEAGDTDAQKALQKMIHLNFSQLITGHGPHPYLERKNVNGLYGSKINGQELLIPMQDIIGRIWNVQKIMPDGTKIFTPGAKTKGLMGFMGREPKLLKHAKHIYICEGFATAATIDMAVESRGDKNYYVIAAFTASNLTLVTKNLKKKYPHIPVTVCGDNDWTKDINVGHDAAFEASLEASTALVVPPNELGVSDFNDVMIKHGMAHTLKLLDSGAPEQRTTKHGFRYQRSIQHYADGMEALPVKYNEKGAPLIPDDYEVAQYVLDYYDTKWGIASYGKDIFLYQGTHWKICEETEYKDFHAKIQVAGGGKFSNRKVRGILNEMFNYIPVMDRDPWIMNTDICNLRNCTLEMGRDGVITAREHRKEDYCIYHIPIDYDPKAKNPLFEKVFKEMFAKDPDANDKIKALQEMYGACLFPKYPKIFLLHGKAERGKTTFIIPAARLLHEMNISRVEPHMFGGFDMESMAGKLVNIVTDIDIETPIKSAQLKKIEDRVPVTMKRKYLKDIKTPMPAVHIFGANGYPKTFEKSDAFDRRFILIDCSLLVLPADTIVDFGNKVFDASPSGILNWALEGTSRIAAQGGKFTKFAASQRSMDEMKLQNNKVAQFVNDIKEGLVPDLEAKVGAFLPKDAAWRDFVTWHNEVEQRPPTMGRNTFYSIWCQHFSEAQHQNQRCWVGVCATKPGKCG